MDDEIRTRITRLERQNRVFRAGALFAVLGAFTCGGGGITSNFERVNTGTLVVVTQDDQPSITLARDGSITFHRAEGSVVLTGEALERLLKASG